MVEALEARKLLSLAAYPHSPLAEWTPPYASREDLFAPPQRSRAAARQSSGDDESVELIGRRWTELGGVEGARLVAARRQDVPPAVDEPHR